MTNSPCNQFMEALRVCVFGQGQGHISKFPLSPQCKTSISNNSVLSRTQTWSLLAAWGFRIWRIEWCDRRLCHMTGNTRIRGWSCLRWEGELVICTNTVIEALDQRRTCHTSIVCVKPSLIQSCNC